MTHSCSPECQTDKNFALKSRKIDTSEIQHSDFPDSQWGFLGAQKVKIFDFSKSTPNESGTCIWPIMGLLSAKLTKFTHIFGCFFFFFEHKI